MIGDTELAPLEFVFDVDTVVMDEEVVDVELVSKSWKCTVENRFDWLKASTKSK